MCSIGGFIAARPLERSIARDLCSALLYYGTERGSQSAGVFVNGNVVKKAISPDDFIETSDFFNAFNVPPRMALTHTRQPTSGGTGDAQAQPFQDGNTVTVHNGFYFDIGGIREKWTLKKKSGVDSELITNFIETYGIEMLPKFMETTDGPSSIAAFHRGALYLTRSDNPMSYIFLNLRDDNRILVFASTPSILLSSIRYCWLTGAYKTKELREDVVFRATPLKLKQVSKKYTTDQWTQYMGGYGSYTSFGSSESSGIRKLYDDLGKVSEDDHYEYHIDYETGGVRKVKKNA